MNAECKIGDLKGTLGLSRHIQTQSEHEQPLWYWFLIQESCRVAALHLNLWSSIAIKTAPLAQYIFSSLIGTSSDEDQPKTGSEIRIFFFQNIRTYYIRDRNKHFRCKNWILIVLFLNEDSFNKVSPLSSSKMRSSTMLLLIFGIVCKWTVSSAVEEGILFTEDGTYIPGKLLSKTLFWTECMIMQLIFIFRILWTI